MVTVIDSPVYTTGVGLVLYGMHNQDSARFGPRSGNKGLVGRTANRMRDWFGGFFDGN
jgi:cell division protein FtsA